MKAYILSIIFLYLVQNLPAQGILPSDWGLKACHIDDKELGRIDFYITGKGIDQRKPLVFMASETRGLPVMLVVISGEGSLQIGTIPPDQIQYCSEKCHVAFIGKAGTPFCDTLYSQEINPIRNLEEYQPSAEYIQKCGMEWEVRASSLIIDTLCRMLPVSGNKVIAMGFSGGGRIVTGLAAENRMITHLVSVINGGFYISKNSFLGLIVLS